MPRLNFLFYITILLVSCSTTPALPMTLVYVQEGQLMTSKDWGASATMLNFSPPDGCTIRNLYPASQGAYLAILLDCPFGPLTEVVDLLSGKSDRPLAEPIDNRFLAWNAEGGSLYLLVDSFGNSRVLRVNLQNGSTTSLPLPASTYALACSPDSQTLVYAQTPGLGFGSELWMTDLNGKNARLLIADSAHILALPRWSPDGQQLAYIQMPDTPVPFPPGELWLLDINTGQRHFLSVADAGHGYAPAWSPDGKLIAFVGREGAFPAQNAEGNLEGGIYVIETETGARSVVSRPKNAEAGTPVWSPDGGFIVFPLRLDGKMNLWAYRVATGETIPLTQAGACCPAWIGK
jgi:Tol biopolymer transport system component